EPLLVGAGDAGGRVAQAAAVGIVAGPANEGADRGFGLRAPRPVGAGCVRAREQHERRRRSPFVPFAVRRADVHIRHRAIPLQVGYWMLPDEKRSRGGTRILPRKMPDGRVLAEHSGRGAMREQPFDCLVVGGGPGGLTAAIYLARYRRRFLVIDAGESRTSLI